MKLQVGSLVLLLGLVAAGVSVWSLRDGGAPPAQGAGRPPFMLAVSLGAVEVGDLAPKSRVAGEVRALQQARLAFERAGRVQALHHQEGEQVAAGVCLAELDPREAQLAVESARARLELAKSELSKAQAGVREEEKARLEAETVALRAELDKARLEAERAESLLEGGVASAAERDRRNAELRVAQARLEASEQRAREARAGTRLEDLAIVAALLANAQSTLQTAELELERCQLRAPFAGQLVRRWRSAGDSVSASEPIFELVGVAQREVVVDLPRSLSLQLEEGGVALVSEERSGARVSARLDRLASSLDGATRNARAWVNLPADADARLTPGAAVEVEFAWRPLTGVLLVPSDAVRRTDQGQIVVVAEASPEQGAAPFAARFVPVKLLGAMGEKSAVEPLGAELEAGMQVVVVGVEMAFPKAPLMPRAEARQP